MHPRDDAPSISAVYDAWVASAAPHTINKSLNRVLTKKWFEKFYLKTANGAITDSSNDSESEDLTPSPITVRRRDIELADGQEDEMPSASTPNLRRSSRQVKRKMDWEAIFLQQDSSDTDVPPPKRMRTLSSDSIDEAPSVSMIPFAGNGAFTIVGFSSSKNSSFSSQISETQSEIQIDLSDLSPLEALAEVAAVEAQPITA